MSPTRCPAAGESELFLPTTRGPFATSTRSHARAERARRINGVGPPNGPKNSFPRLATDSDGTVYLAFREPAGTGLSIEPRHRWSSVGTIWVGAMVYFDGAQWHGPGVLGFTDAVSDNRPSILALGPGAC